MEEPIEVDLEFLDGGMISGATLVSPMGDNRYRLEVDPLSCFAAENVRDLRRLPNYGDVIEALELAPGKLRFVRVLKRGWFKRFVFFASESPELTVVRSDIEELGGFWEQVFGGVAIMYVPRGSEYDASKELSRLMALGEADPRAEP